MYIMACILLVTMGIAKSTGESNPNRTAAPLGDKKGKINPKVAAETTESTFELMNSKASNKPNRHTDLKATTTQNYEDSKLLFSYVISANSEKPPKKPEENDEDGHDEEQVDIKEEAEDDKEDMKDEEDEEEAQHSHLEEEEEEGEHEHLEEEDEDEGHYEEKEEDDEKDNLKSQDLTEDDEGYEEDEPPNRNIDEEEHVEDDEKMPYSDREKDIDDKPEDKESENYEEEFDEEEGHDKLEEENAEPGSTQPPLRQWQYNSPPSNGEQRRLFEFTTIQPYQNPRPVSYASVVYDPDGKSKTELSGSFYKKPLRKSPHSGVFQKVHEHVSEDTKTISVTNAPEVHERSIQAPPEEEEEAEDDKEYMEPEAVTSNIQYTVEESVKYSPRKVMRLKPVIPWRYLDWLGEELERQPRFNSLREQSRNDETISLRAIPDQEKIQDGTTTGQTNRRDRFDHTTPPQRQTSKPSGDNDEELERELMKNTRQELHNIGKINYYGHTLRPETRQNLVWVTEGVKDRNQPKPDNTVRPQTVKYSTEWSPVVEPERHHQKSLSDFQYEQMRLETPRPRKEWSTEEPVTMYYQEPNRSNNNLNSETNEESEEEENHESETKDLMQEKDDDNFEEWREESIQKDNLPDDDKEDVTETSDETNGRYVPMKKDRNQLYEYVIDDGAWRQSASENRYTTTTTPKRQEPFTRIEPMMTDKTTVKPNITQPIRQAKPQSYAFGTITKPESDKFVTFESGDNDIMYNKIVSNIQSLFSTTEKPGYEHQFLPDCRKPLPTYDSANYETFIRPSHVEEENESEGEDEEEDDDSMHKRLPMKTYIVQKNIRSPKIIKKPSGVKVTVYPMSLRPTPASFRNTVYLSPNRVMRKVIYYQPQELMPRYSPTNQILRIIRPQRTDHIAVPSSRRMIIIRNS